MTTQHYSLEYHHLNTHEGLLNHNVYHYLVLFSFNFNLSSAHFINFDEDDRKYSEVKDIIIFMVSKIRIMHEYKQEERISFVTALPRYSLILLDIQV
jgi:hypothetical protein